MNSKSLYKIQGRGCRDTYVVANNVATAIKLSNLKEFAIKSIARIASETILDDDCPVLMVED